MRAELVGRQAELASLRRALRRSRGALLMGAAGIGKTRLAAELVDRVRAEGWWVEELIASPATRSIPFGALVHLLPSDRPDDRAGLLRHVLTSLEERAGRADLLVAVDDAHFLDEPSLAVLAEVVKRGVGSVVATVRAGEHLPATLMSLWSSGELERIDLEELPEEAAATLTEGYLGGRTDDALAADLYRLAGGNPLLLRELLVDAQSSGALAVVNGMWSASRPLATGARVQDLMAARLAGLESPAREVLDRVALVEPVRVPLVEEDPDFGVLAELEERLLVEVHDHDDVPRVRTDHPLLGEALRAAMPTTRRASVLRHLAQRLVDMGLPAPGDASRAVRWLTEAGDDPPAALARAAAREALAAFDLDGAASLAAWADDGASAEPAYVLGETERLRGNPAAAEEHLARASALATSDDERVRIAMTRSSVLAFGLGDPKGAVTLLEDTAGEVDDAQRALELVSEASFLATLLGQFENVRRTSTRILDLLDLPDEARWTAAINLAYALVMLGDVRWLDDAVDTADAVRTVVQDERPEGVDLLWTLRNGAHVLHGRLRQGEQEIGSHLDMCRREGVYHGLTATFATELMLLRASRSAAAVATDAVEQLAVLDPFGSVEIARAYRALVAAMTGEVDDAEAMLRLLDEDAVDVRGHAVVGRARASTAAARGQRGAAAELVAEAGRVSIEGGHVTFGVLAVYDAVRYGAAADVAADLASTLAGATSPLLAALRDHSRAAARGDADGLEGVGRRLASMGAPLLAATAFSHAVHLHGGEADIRRAAALCRAWSRRLGPFVGPSLPEVEGTLTDRELDVAELAATGLPSREVGRRLFISARTVDNHLRAVYAKLALGGRADLATVFTTSAGS